ARAFFASLSFEPPHDLVGPPLVREITGRLGFLERVGLDYLTLDRGADTLSGGELQRVRLGSQIGAGGGGGGAGTGRTPDGACTRGTPTGWSPACGTCATPATACWWSSTTRR